MAVSLYEQRRLVNDPISNRGYVASTDQSALGRPEFLFLDVKGRSDDRWMRSCTKIIESYTLSNTLPSDLEVIEEDPFNTGLTLRFVARKPSGLRILAALQMFYLHQECPHGILVLIPVMKGPMKEEWGCSDIARTPESYTVKDLNAYIRRHILAEHLAVQEMRAKKAALGGGRELLVWAQRPSMSRLSRFLRAASQLS